MNILASKRVRSKIIQLILAAIAFTIITGCTTVPPRFNQVPSESANTGYVIELEDSNGFHLETFLKSYSFFPNPDDNIQEAKQSFIRIAQFLAEERGRKSKPIIPSMLQANATRNIVDGNYSIYVSGRVDYEEN